MREIKSGDIQLIIANSDIPLTGCAVNIAQDGKNYPISSKLSKTITEAVESDKLKNYWRWKNKFGMLSHTVIDWNTLSKDYLNMHHPSHIWLCKFRTVFCGVGEKMIHYGQQTYSK